MISGIMKVFLPNVSDIHLQEEILPIESVNQPIPLCHTEMRFSKLVGNFE
jgi:hypothetical protein